MAKNESPNRNELPDQDAIAEALVAEHHAAEAIAACEAEAERLIDQAQARATTILSRGDARISRLHRDCATKLDAEIGRLRQHHFETQNRLGRERQPDEAALLRAVERLAREMTEEPPAEADSEGEP